MTEENAALMLKTLQSEYEQFKANHAGVKRTREFKGTGMKTAPLVTSRASFQGQVTWPDRNDAKVIAALEKDVSMKNAFLAANYKRETGVRVASVPGYVNAHPITNEFIRDAGGLAVSATELRLLRLRHGRIIAEGVVADVRNVITRGTFDIDDTTGTVKYSEDITFDQNILDDYLPGPPPNHPQQDLKTWKSLSIAKYYADAINAFVRLDVTGGDVSLINPLLQDPVYTPSRVDSEQPAFIRKLMDEYAQEYIYPPLMRLKQQYGSLDAAAVSKGVPLLTQTGAPFPGSGSNPELNAVALFLHEQLASALRQGVFTISQFAKATETFLINPLAKGVGIRTTNKGSKMGAVYDYNEQSMRLRLVTPVPQDVKNRSISLSPKVLKWASTVHIDAIYSHILSSPYNRLRPDEMIQERRDFVRASKSYFVGSSDFSSYDRTVTGSFINMVYKHLNKGQGEWMTQLSQAYLEAPFVIKTSSADKAIVNITAFSLDSGSPATSVVGTIGNLLCMRHACNLAGYKGSQFLPGFSDEYYYASLGDDRDTMIKYGAKLTFKHIKQAFEDFGFKGDFEEHHVFLRNMFAFRNASKELIKMPGSMASNFLAPERPKFHYGPALLSLFGKYVGLKGDPVVNESRFVSNLSSFYEDLTGVALPPPDIMGKLLQTDEFKMVMTRYATSNAQAAKEVIDVMRGLSMGFSFESEQEGGEIGLDLIPNQMLSATSRDISSRVKRPDRSKWLTALSWASEVTCALQRGEITQDRAFSMLERYWNVRDVITTVNNQFKIEQYA